MSTESVKTVIIVMVGAFMLLTMFSIAAIFGPWTGWDFLAFCLEVLAWSFVLVCCGIVALFLYREIG